MLRYMGVASRSCASIRKLIMESRRLTVSWLIVCCIGGFAGVHLVRASINRGTTTLLKHADVQGGAAADLESSRSPRESVAASRSDSGDPKELYFCQTLDHFNFIDNRTWDQRYFLIDDFWLNSGPLFFYTGNEGPIESFMNNSGFIFTLAKQFNALVVFAEHRYYGKSLPLGEDSLTPPGIGYLTVEQAMADYAVLIQSLKTQYTGIFKVIAFGGSYGGMLTAWMRFKYPNLVDGGLAGSAPIYYTEGIVSKTAFFGKVTQDFADVDQRCPEYVRDGYNELFYLARYGLKGYDAIKGAMQLCDLPLNDDDINHIAGWVRNSFTSLAMVNYPYEANFLAPLPTYPVNASCQILLNSSNKLSGLAQAAGLFYNGTTGELTCFNTTEEFIDCADPTGCGTGPDAEAWDYQACTEMVLASDTNNVTDMFPPFKYDPSAYCEKKWGVSFRSDWMKTQFWGKSISSASNIIFSNGDLDPWSVGGVLRNISDTLTAVVIEGGAHHLDLRAPDPRDPTSVTEARELETAIIKDWLNQ